MVGFDPASPTHPGKIPLAFPKRHCGSSEITLYSVVNLSSLE
jgi:hypothetical protein